MTKPTVLFVDDEPYITKSLQRAFKRYYDVRIANSGAEALKIIEDNRVEVIVSDQRMAVMTGVELLKKVAQLSPVTVRILLTGYADVDAAIESVNAGEIYRYFNKPWKNSELKVAIDDGITIADLTRKSVVDLQEKDFIVDKKLLLTEQDLSIICVSQKDSLPKEISSIFKKNKIYYARSVNSVIKCISTRSQVSVIVAEMDISDDNAIELIMAMKQRRPEIIVIVITDQKDIARIVELINYGQVFRVFNKGYKLAEIKSNIRLAFSRYLMEQNSPALLYRSQVMSYTDDMTFSVSESVSDLNASDQDRVNSYKIRKHKRRMRSANRVIRAIKKIRDVRRTSM